MATNTQEVITKVFLDSEDAEKRIKSQEEKTKEFRKHYEDAFHFFTLFSASRRQCASILGRNRFSPDR